MTEEEIIFDTREVPELSQEQKIAHGPFPGTKDRKPYVGNRWQKNKKTIAVVETLFNKLESIRKQRGFNTKGELMEYLIELDTAVNPKLETIFQCRKCNQQLDVPPEANLERIIHKDLYRESQCNGSIVKKQKIVKDAKDKETGTTEHKDEQTGIIEYKDEQAEHIIHELTF